MKLEVNALGLQIAGRVLCSAVSVVVRGGEFWCVLGRNGAGKTTLLRSLAGLREPDQGQVLLDGRPLSLWPRQALARQRAFLPQGLRDSFSSSVLETVITGCYPHHAGLGDQWRFAGSEQRALADSVLTSLGLETMLARDILTLSGGERQRVAIAALLMQNAAIQILDEPTAHLDFDKQLLVMEVLKRGVDRPGRPAGVVMSLHDINLAARFATHVLLFSDDGTVLAGPATTILSAQNLSRAYHHRVTEISSQGRRWFVPN